MNTTLLKILQNCSNKSYDSLVQANGESAMKQLISMEYITVLGNGNVTRTEKGMQMSRPVDLTESRYQEQGYTLITDSTNSFNDHSLIVD